MHRVSVIGTSGRSVPPGEKLTKELFNAMIAAADSTIQDNYEKDDVILVSGASAWSDHVAVHLYLHHGYSRLELYSPCDVTAEGFHDTGVVDWRINPGGTLNYYFKKFNAVRGRSTNAFQELRDAVDKGALLDTSKKSFHSRNSVVAKSELLIAFSWGKDEPEDGGTLDTWNKCKGEKIHISLTNLV